MDVLEHVQQLKDSIKELTHVISVKNRRIKKLEKQVENYRDNKQLEHLKALTERRAIKIVELNHKINAYELEKLK